MRRANVPDTGTTSRYETLWIVASADRPLRATLPDLIIPRSTGFWRAGVAETCADEQHMYAIDELWTVGAAERPVVGTPCPTVSPTYLPGGGMSQDSTGAEVADTTPVVCQVSGVSINFVSGEYVQTTTTSGQTEECEPRGDRWDTTPATRRWENDSTLTLVDVLGSDAQPAIERAKRVAVRDTSEECQAFTGDGNAEMIQDWYVSRERGRWTANVFHAIYGSQCQQEAEVRTRLVPGFTGHDGLRPGWQVIAHRVRNLTDAFTSPSGDMIVAITRDSLYAFASDGKTVGRRLLSMSFNSPRIVMAQWATGRHVARWDAELGTLLPQLRPVVVAHPIRDSY